MRNRQIQIAVGVGHHPQQVQGICMVRFGCQHALIAGLGLGQSSGPVVIEARLQELRRNSGRRIACLSNSGGSAALLAIHARI